jgi:DNA polymerase-1
MRGELVAIALAEASGDAWLISMAQLDPARALPLLRPLLESEQRTWIGHDLKRCANALGRRGIELGGGLLDVSLAAYVADPSQQVQRPEVLVRTYLGIQLPSAEDRFGKGAKRRTAMEVSAAELGEHMGAEAAHAMPLHEAVEDQLRERGQLPLYRELEVPLVRVLSKMERAGVRIDLAKLAALDEQLTKRLGDMEVRIHSLAGETFNIGSPRQLQQILFEKLKLPPSKKTKTGFSTDESVLEDLAAQGHEIPAERAGPPRDRAHPHDLQSDRRRYRASVVPEPEPPEHPDPHARGAGDPHRLHPRGWLPVGLGRLQPDRAARSRSLLGGSGPGGGLPPGRGHPRAHGLAGLRGEGGGGVR